MHEFISHFPIYDTMEIQQRALILLHGQRTSPSFLPTTAPTPIGSILVIGMKSRTAAVNRSSASANRSRVVVLLGLVLADLTPVPNPLLLFHTGLLLLSDFLSRVTISFLHAEHSLKWWFLFCLSLIHNQYLFKFVHPHSSFNCVARKALALRGW